LRHTPGETEWTINSHCTSNAEIPLTKNGISQVGGTGEVLVGPGKLIDPAKLAHVFTSPRQRAVVTLDMLLGPAHKERLEREGRVTVTEDITE
jgi:probable phosphoglycerate mutase